MNKLFLFTLIISLGYCNSLQSQSDVFSRVLFKPSTDLHVFSLVNSFDNGYMLTTTKNYANGYIIKVDSACNPLWAKEIINPNAVSFPNITLNNILKTNDSCYIVSGHAYNQTNEKREVLCIKITNEGDTLWTTTIGGDNYVSILSACKTYDSGIVLVGNAYNISLNDIVFIARLDVNGNVQWTKSIEMGDHNNSATSIKQLPDSNFIVTGFMSNYPPYESYPFLLNLSGTGEINWAKKYITTDIKGRGNDVIITDTGLLVYIEMYNGCSFLQTDFSGNVLWNSSYGIYHGTSIGDVSPKLYRTSNNYLLGVVGDESGGSIFKIDLNGNIQWHESLFLNAVNVTETKSDEYLIYGNGPLLGVKNNNYNYGEIGFIQVDTLGVGVECVFSSNYTVIEDSITSEPATFSTYSGHINTSIPIEVLDATMELREGCVDMTGDISDGTSANELVVYPNPGNGNFNFILSKQKSGTLNIYDNFGKTIYQTLIENVKTEIDLSAQSNGVYYYIFRSYERDILSGSLLISK